MRMTKEEILENIKNAIEKFVWQNEVEAYIEGYLKALLDCYKIDRDMYYDVKAELEENE